MSKNYFTTSGGIEHDLKFKGVWSLGVAIQGEPQEKFKNWNVRYLISCELGIKFMFQFW